MKLIKIWKRKLNLCNQLLKPLIWAMGSPCLLKIGLTQDEKERKVLKVLLTEFQEVFA